MVFKSWDDLPENMKNDSVKRYYEILEEKHISLIMKRSFDLIAAIITLVILLPLFLLISIAIKIDSKGPVMFRQVRITQYGKPFRIFKFRTMVNNAERLGTQVTTKNDGRVTRVGKILRKLRLDEVPQLLNIITGEMTFVGTRPEVLKYVEKYSEEMMATLLLPAGVTSEASIQYKDEELLLANADNADETYVKKVLPEKMRYNLRSIESFSFFSDIKTMFRTVLAVAQKDKITEKVSDVVASDKNIHL
jgi:lipopolysaccharide/colanic/teichoic acid biosynthesis glycosyltransferase